MTGVLWLVLMIERMMKRQFGWGGRIDALQEIEELTLGMVRLPMANDRACLHVQGGKQRYDVMGK